MADQRIQYTDEMVGAGHPSKTDTLNKLALTIVDSSGYPRSTAFPAFKAGAASTLTVSANSTWQIIFGNESYDNSNSYDSTTGKFVTPSTGQYLFGANLLITNHSNASIFEYVGLQKNGSDIKYFYALHPSSGTIQPINFTAFAYASAISTFTFAIDNRGDSSLALASGVEYNSIWGIKIG